MPRPGGPHGGPHGGHPGGPHGGPHGGGPGFGGGHRPPMGGGMPPRPPMGHRPPMGGGMWYRPRRSRGCCGCLLPVLGVMGAIVFALLML